MDAPCLTTGKYWTSGVHTLGEGQYFLSRNDFLRENVFLQNAPHRPQHLCIHQFYVISGKIIISPTAIKKMLRMNCDDVYVVNLFHAGIIMAQDILFPLQ